MDRTRSPSTLLSVLISLLFYGNVHAQDTMMGPRFDVSTEQLHASYKVPSVIIPLHLKALTLNGSLHYSSGQPIGHPGTQTSSSGSGGSVTQDQVATASPTYKIPPPPSFSRPVKPKGDDDGDGKKPPDGSPYEKPEPADAKEKELLSKQQFITFWAALTAFGFNLQTALTQEQLEWPSVQNGTQYLQLHLAAGLYVNQFQIDTNTPSEQNWFISTMVTIVTTEHLTTMVNGWNLGGHFITSGTEYNDLSAAITQFIATQNHRNLIKSWTDQLWRILGEDKCWQLINALRKHLGWPLIG